MFHVMIALLLVEALVFAFVTVMAVRAYIRHRAEEVAPFRDYFGPGYRRDLLRQSSWSDDENLYVLRTRYAVNIPDRGATRLDPRNTSSTLRTRRRD
jgi:hypothetical protein